MTKKLKEPLMCDLRALSNNEIASIVHKTDEGRAAFLKPVSEFTTEQVRSVTPLTWLQHLACVLFLTFGVPTGVFTIPVLLYVIGKLIVGNVTQTYVVFAVFVLLPLGILPQKFVPSILQSWLAIGILKYFSFTMIMEYDLDASQARIIVAPPHGVFPYGNIMAVIEWPLMFKDQLRGLASSTALMAPIMKQIMRSIGITDASRSNARRLLENGESLGIPTGGVAEVFETGANDECIILKNRKGLVKLAIRTGVELVPCYVFGNTKVLGCWGGEGLPFGGKSLLRHISRKIGLALVIIYGRFGLPIPRRVPLMAVGGEPIPTKHIQCEDPSPELVDEVQAKLLKSMETVFDKYKGLYGWENKRLIIK